MSYSALLFCPDEKTSRVVTQVLSELEFAVEACNEPFAAVKKMMAQHFDAIVVDCDNEQNATLLFKSARNSNTNQGSLSVAVVEGQAGVAKAFRIGANLVLTKPINVEQSKGTLRVARGLLRKGEAPKAATAPVPTPAAASKPAAMPTPPASAPKPAFTPAATMPSPAFVPPSRAVEMPQATASAAAFELEADPGPQPEPTEAALLESMRDPASGIKKAAEPFASNDPIEETKAKPAADFFSKPSTPAMEARPFAGGSFGAGGAAAAAAPAKEVVSLAASVPAVATPAEQTGFHAPEPPSFGSISAMQAAPARSSSKFVPIAVILILAAAGGGYFGWQKFQHKAAAPAGTAVNAAPQATPTVTPNVTENAPASEPPAVEVEAPTTVTAQPTSLAGASSTPEKTPAAKTAAPTASPTPTKSQPAPVQQAAVEPLMVKAEEPKPTAQPAEQPAAPAEPPSLTLGSGSADSAISGIVSSAPVHVPKASDTIKVSQGVAQGLLITKVPPVYPAQAISARIQGAVVLQANITKDGSISGLQVVSGDSLLAKSAVTAVKQWKYKPYFLDGQPVQIQTQITVNFKLP